MDLNINYEETRSLGSQVMSKAETFSNLVRNVNDINTQVAQNWNGTDAAKYVGAVNEQIQNMAELAETIQVIGSYLVRVSNAYEQAAADNANAIRN